jgi:hypothetical protein
MLLLLLAGTGLALGVANAAPARLPHQPEKPPELPPAHIEFSGTRWFGRCYQDQMWIVFEKDGTLTYGYNANVFKNGSWNLQGTSLYFEMNNKYLEFRGSVQGNVLQGEAWNVRGLRWQTWMEHTSVRK